MNKRFYNYVIILLTIPCLISCTFSCRNSHDRSRQTKENISTTVKKVNKIDTVIFYLENSESMFGYVNGLTEYVQVVSELSEKPDFAAEKTNREFNFINGGNQLQVNRLGNNPSILRSKLNTQGFNCGNIKNSNLNSMFQIALEKAQNNTISILISDAIYDSPLNILPTEANETRSKFISRLENGDIQTLLIKLTSNFNGNYFYSSHSGSTFINHPRPFYVWIFGKSELLNKYFPEEYISTKLKGFENYARFLILKENAIPYQITASINRKGNFRPSHTNKNQLNQAGLRHGEFQFSNAVDFSSLPFSDSYLTDTINYSSSNLNFKITKVEKIKENQKHEVTSFTHPTHIVTIHTDKDPKGLLEIVLKNEIPDWIKQTDINNEAMIDNTHTFGFKFLTDAISEAYSHENKGKKLAKFNIEIK